MFNDNADDNIFGSIDNADARGQRNPYLTDGNYLLQIKGCTLKKARTKRNFYLVEFTILESDNEERPAGMTVTWMTDVDNDMGPINIKRFLAAAAGIDPNSEEANKEITSKVAMLSVSSDQPLAGAQIYVNVQTVTTKAGSNFSEHRWQPVTA